MNRWAAVLILAVSACGPSTSTEEDPSVEELCREFDAPAHEEASNCPDLDPDQPTALFGCQRGSGYAGQWAVDADGLPRYDLAVEHRCDPAGYVESSLDGERLAPVHLVGNGRGVVAVAHASGAVELYAQERGGTWLNQVDTWKDAGDEDYPMQIGGGFSYLVVDGEVRSTRFDDLAVGDATERQSRRFGVGYVETVTKWDDLLVTRRVFAPDIDARAVVAEVTIQNLTDQYREVGLVELWDVNVRAMAPAPDADVDADGGAALRRERRGAMAGFRHTVRWSQEERTALVDTAAVDAGGVARDDVSAQDRFVDPIFLAPIDAGEDPDAAWLSDEELWDGPRTRRPPGALDGGGDADTREVTVEGAGQRALVAVRIPVQVPTEAPVVRRFAFGYVPEGRSLDTDLEALRDGFGELGTNSIDAWKEKLVYVAAPEVDGAAALQREVAWSSYQVQAGATGSEYFGARAVGPGGAARYVQGVEGAAADLALMADALVWVDPSLARDTLLHALATQRAKTEDAAYQLPAAWGGVGFLAGDGEPRRTDSYFLLPAAVARYVAASRDATLLEAEVPYWPRASGEAGTVIDHLAGALEYVTATLGEAGGGFIAAGDSDFGGAGPWPGEASVFNAGAAAAGFPLAADVVEDGDAALAAGYRDVADAQRALLESDAWSGDHYLLDGGGGDEVALYPQVFPLLAGVATADQRDDVLALVEDMLETPTGARLFAGADAGIHPVANAWLTAAYALRDAADGWSSLWRNGMAAHAEAYPETWVGVFTAPAAWSAGDPAAADARMPGVAQMPALSAQVPAATLRALFDLLGVAPAADSLVIDPRVPGETVSVVAPRFELTLRPDAVSGALVPSAGGTIRLDVTLPTGLRGGVPSARVDDVAVPSTRDGDVLSFDVELKKNTRVTWSID